MSEDAAGVGVPDRCSAVLAQIYGYIDGEITAGALTSVREHLMDCPPCLEQHDVQVALKALVRRCCQDRAPESLRVRIVAHITEVTGLQHIPGGPAVVQVSRVALLRD